MTTKISQTNTLTYYCICMSWCSILWNILELIYLMGASKSKPEPASPKGPQAPEWLQEFHLAPAKADNPLLEQPPRFKYELAENKIEVEFKRKVALECSRRCLHIDQMSKGLAEGESKLTYPEQLCINRCITKVYLSREIIEEKLK